MKARTHTKRLIAAVALATACLTLLCVCPAEAKTLNREGFSDVPPETVSIDYPLKISAAYYRSSNNAFQVTKTRVWDTDCTAVKYRYPLDAGERISGSFSLQWYNAGIDDDGDNVNLTITVSDIRVDDAVDNLIILDDASNLCMDAITEAGDPVNVQMTVTIKVDKNAAVPRPAPGTMLIAFTDIDVAKDVNRSEQVTLGAGFGDTVWVPPTNFLDISSDATRFTATQIDEDTYDSGFVTTGSTSGCTLTWQGHGCGTYLLMPFRANDQIIKATAGAGGSISDAGETHVRWKNDKTYTIKADEHYSIKDVQVDGKSIGAKSSYTFTKVITNHTIHATFQEDPKFSVTFVDGLGKELSKQSVYKGDSAKAPADPTREDWTFSGWDKDFSNVQGDLTVTAQWDPVIKVKVPTLVACKIMPDGSVVAPGGYAIENLSPVAVDLQSVTTADMPSCGSYTLTDAKGNVVHAFSEGSEQQGESVRMGVGGKAPLTWNVGDLVGEDAQEILYKALEGPTSLCNVTFVFEQA